MQFTIKGTGDPAACATLGQFWQEISPQGTLEHIGLTPIADLQQHHFQVAFTATTKKCPLDQKSFWILLSVHCVRFMMKNFIYYSGIRVVILWCSRILWQESLSVSTTVQQILGALQFSMPALIPGLPRLLCKNQFLDPNLALHQITDSYFSDTLTFTLTSVEPTLRLTGGGGKEYTKTQARNALAATLLESGYDLRWITEATDKVISRAPLAAIAQAAQIPGSQARIQSILKLCHDSGVDTKTASKKSTMVQAKQGVTKAKKQDSSPPNPAHYKLEKGFFQNADQTHATQIAQVTTHASSVCLMDPTAAIPWLREGAIISRDELAIVILHSSLPCSTKLDTQHLTAPLRNQDNSPVIVAATLVQLGEKHIQSLQPADKTVPLNKCTVCSFTLWRSDWDLPTWDQFLKQTQATLREHLGEHGTHDKLTSLWGRSLRKKGKPAALSDAESIQLHGAVVDTSLQPLLSQSGFSNIFITPKTPQGRVDDENWKVIWVSGDLPHVTSVACNSPSCQSLIKGKSTLGLRFRKENYDEAWQQIHPGLPKPLTTGGQLVFRLEPLPFGCTSDTVQTWAQHINWPLKAIKAVGPRGWIVSSSQQPPPGVLLFNGAPLIAKHLPPKQTLASNPTILAGPKPKQTTELQDLTSDPWMTYNQKRDADAAFQHLSSPAPSNPRSIGGPTEQKFQQQENRLAALESTIADIQTAQSEQAAATQGLKQATEQAFKIQDEHLKNFVKSAIGTARTDLEKSVSNAMENQTKQINQNLLDLKAMIQSTKRTRGPDGEEIEEMQS